MPTPEELLERADPALAAGVSRAFLDHDRVVPVCFDHGELVVASPDADAPLDGLMKALGAARARVVVVSPTDYRRLRMTLDLSRLGAARRPERGEPSPSSNGATVDLLAVDPSATAELVALFHAILLDAIAERASDIHLERYHERVRVRLRVDGDLHDVGHYRLTPAQLLGLINVIKVDAHLDIAERRLPQGGRYSTRAGGHTFDLRVQTQPCLYGEHVVIRLLPQDSALLTVEDLGFPDEHAARYRRMLDSPQGMLLVVGPTGSGKSTTLYAGLQVLARDLTRKVITVEDPIEYALEDVQQTQVRPELGWSFAHAMRAFVREDPDVILVGEVRDGETALEAIRASQTGHLVLSTLHCNDAVDAVQRLVDLGMHPNSIAAELLAIIAQRLAKRLCTSCREPDPAPDGALVDEVFAAGAPPGFRCWRARGCSRCNQRGTHGRIAVVELLPVDARLRNAIARRLTVDELRADAMEAGLLAMRDHALRLVDQGVIALAELRSILSPEALRGRSPSSPSVAAS